jgi:glycosyltransferase involved in cell wall biosynthesis
VEETLMAKLLALTARLPYPPQEGHQLRAWHILRALAGEHEVTLLSFARNDDALDQCGPLREMLVHLETFSIPAQRTGRALAYAAAKSLCGPRPFVAEKYSSAQMRVRAAALARAADLVHVDILPLMQLLGANGERVPVVLNAHNVEHQLLRQRATIEPRLPQRLFLRSQVAKLMAFEREACRRASHVLACSADDADSLAALAPETPISVVPNGVDVERNRPAAGGTPDHPARVVFVGQMGWFPNRDGVQWFIRDILPRILAVRPDAEFVLVGKSDGLRVPAPLRAHVRLPGFVEDLESAIHHADVYVVPLRTGSGTRLKVLEAMAFGKPIVTTHIGAQGIDLEPGAEALFAHSAEDFAAAVLRLIANPHEAARLGAAARAKAQRLYDWNTIGRQVVSIYSELLQESRVARAARQR